MPNAENREARDEKSRIGNMYKRCFIGFNKGGDRMIIINLVVIDGKEVPISQLTEKERKSLADNSNREALTGRNYVEEKTA